MRVCFVGFGSIAKRHISNLQEINKGVEIDLLRSGINKHIEDEYLNKIKNIYYCAADIVGEYDAVFITNPTSMHYDTLLTLIDKSNCFFIEKPIFETGDEDLGVLNLKGKTCYVACPLRYTNVIQYLKENVDFSSVYSMRCISSSYLPDWRPGTDYKKTYSAHRDMGGGVSIDLIHEWDYINYLIGTPLKVQSIIAKKSNLEIDSDDIAIYIAEYEDKVVEVHLDYFGRKNLRQIELIGKDDTIVADLINQKIQFLKGNRSIDLSQDRNEFQKRELIHFLDIIQGKCSNDNDINEAVDILKITRGKR